MQLELFKLDKKCSKCKIEKPLDEFDFRNDTKNYRSYCIDCRKKKDKEYNIRIGKNKGVLAYHKNLKSQNLKHCKRCNTIKSRDDFDCANAKPSGKMAHCKKCRKEYTEKNKERITKKGKQYYISNKEHVKKINKEYYQKNKEIISIRGKDKRKNNKEEIKSRRIKYYQKNKQKISSRLRNRRKTDYLFKMKESIRSRTHSAFKASRWSKNSGNIEMLGCTYEEAFKHIENQFTEGMSWDNHSLFGWHIDHIIPLASAKTEEELIKLCHYTNLQPLWAEENLSKGDKIISYEN